MLPSPLRLLVIGNDHLLIHLLRRYAEQSGWQLIERTLAPGMTALSHWRPDAIIFLSLEHLQSAQALVAGLAAHETPVLVCASIADQARARELGADACLLHALTYEHFSAVLSATCPPQPR
jgi:hypothetical protein